MRNLRRAYQLLIVSALIVLCSIVVMPSRGECAPAIGRFSLVEGSVDVLRAGALPAIATKTGDSVFTKDIIRTKSGSRAEISFSDGNALKIAQRSRVDISEYVSDDATGKRVINLPKGKVEATVSPRLSKGEASKAVHFEIKTLSAVAGVRGTDFIVFTENNITWLLVKEGSVTIYNPSNPNVAIIVPAGYVTMVQGATPPATPWQASEADTKRMEQGLLFTDKKSDKGSEGESVQPQGLTYTAKDQETYNLGIWGMTTQTPTKQTDVVLPPPNENAFAECDPTKEICEPVILLPVASYPSSEPPSQPPVLPAPNFTLSPAATPVFNADNNTVTIALSSTETLAYSYSLNGGPWISTGSTLTVPLPQDGSYTLSIMATNAQGTTTTVTLPFTLNRYTLGGTAAGTGSVLTATDPTSVTGGVTAIANQTWGGWGVQVNGTFTGGPHLSQSPWSVVVGGTALNSAGIPSAYWLENSSGTFTGTADSGAMTGSSTMNFLSYTNLGVGTGGTVSGSYASTDGGLTGTWQMTSQAAGTFMDTPLNFVSEAYSGTASIDSISGSIMKDGDLAMLLGGTASPWSGSTVPVTAMGTYSTTTGGVPHLLGSIPSGRPLPGTGISNIMSRNILDNTYTTYDGGSFVGYMNGIEANNTINASLYALYIDPNGSAGYLKGAVSGAAYPQIGMFNASGTVTANPMNSSIGIPAAALYDSIYYGSGGAGYLSGTLSGGGGLSGYDFITGLQTMSIANTATGAVEPWGIYTQFFNNSTIFSSRTPSDTFTARIGGYDVLGGTNANRVFTGNYTYADGSSYTYDYRNRITADYSVGSTYYYQAGYGSSYVNYYNDGTTAINLYDPLGYYIGTNYGTWDMAAGLSFIATPPNAPSATLSSSSTYTTASPDYGYWIMDATGTWGGNSMTAPVTGRYLTPYNMGTFSGELNGVYNDASGVWTAINTGSYTGAPLQFSTQFSQTYYPFTEGLMPNGYMDGIIGSPASPFAAAGAAVPAYLIGQNNNWGSYGTWWGGISGNNYVDTGSKYDGWLGGTTRADSSIAGMTYALYVDANGNAGILTGYFAGLNYPDISMWEAQGTLTANIKASGYDPAALFITSNSPFVNNAYGAFSDSTSISPYSYQTETRWLTNPATGMPEPGIFKIELGGIYTAPQALPSGFSLNLGGTNWETSGNSYWRARVDGTWYDSATYAIEGAVTGKYITPYGLGTITGKALGSYDSYWVGGWEAVAMGEFSSVPFQLSDDITGMYYYYDSANGWIDSIGAPMQGFLGTTVSPFAAPGTPVVMNLMGSANPGGYVTWWSDMFGNNYVDASTQFRGWIGGVTRFDNTVTGMNYAIYIDANGNAGILTGDFNGNFDPNLGIWEATGNLTATKFSSDYTGTSIDAHMSFGYPDGLVYGNFNSDPVNTFIQGGDGLQWIYYDTTETKWLVNPVTGSDEPWGIYKIELGGTSSNPWPVANEPFTLRLGGRNWKDNYTLNNLVYYGGQGPYNLPMSYWLARIDGNWYSDATAAIDGAMTGRYLTYFSLGAINGKLLGSWQTGGSGGEWEGVAMGTFSELPLQHVSQFGYDGATCSIGGLVGGPYADPVTGANTSLWSGTPILTVLGNYYQQVDGVGQPYDKTTWLINLYSWNPVQGNNTTYDGGAYTGYFGGADVRGAMTGMLSAVYVDPSGNAGFLKAGLTGNSYKDIQMFELDATAGNVERIQMMTNSPVGPADLVAVTSATGAYWSGYLAPPANIIASGSFSGGGILNMTEAHGSMLGFADWGVWRASAIGNFWGALPSTGTWDISAEVIDTFSSPGSIIITGMSTAGAVTGDPVNGGRLAGSTLGYFASTVPPTPMTGILVGETQGTFNPTWESWQTSQTGQWIESTKLLNMVATDPQTLQKLNIPSVEVGRATLFGSGNNLTVNVKDVVFLSTNSTARPQIWAVGKDPGINGGAGNIYGDFSSIPSTGVPVNLTQVGGNNTTGLLATFNVQQWGATTWGATIGPPGGPYPGGTVGAHTGIFINGAAAGTVGAGTFSGTGAGIVK